MEEWQRQRKRHWQFKRQTYKREAWEAVGVERQRQREQLRQERLGHRVLSERLHGCTGRTAKKPTAAEQHVVARVLQQHHLSAARTSTRDRKATQRLQLDFGPARGFCDARPAGHQTTDTQRARPARGGSSHPSHDTDTKISTGTAGTCTKFSTQGNTDTRSTATKFSTRGTKFSTRHTRSTSQDDSDHDSTSPPYHVEKVAPAQNLGKCDDGEETGELEGVTKLPPNSRDNDSPTLRPASRRTYLSAGDPKQFLIAGSIGDQRVRILVDTGATISFIKSTLVPLLTPLPKVEKSELAVVLGNGETQDTDFFIEADLRVHHCKFDANLHLLELPDAFDVIVGLDWLSKHDGRIRVRDRTLDVRTTMGKRIIAAGCGGVSSASPGRVSFGSW